MLEIYVCVCHGKYSCVLAVTFFMFFVSLVVTAFWVFLWLCCVKSLSSPLVTTVCNAVNILYFVHLDNVQFCICNVSYVPLHTFYSPRGGAV